MKIDVKACAGLLKEHDNILILTHAHPDGDTLGSGFALLRALLKLGKTARVINEDDCRAHGAESRRRFLSLCTPLLHRPTRP